MIKKYIIAGQITDIADTGNYEPTKDEIWCKWEDVEKALREAIIFGVYAHDSCTREDVNNNFERLFKQFMEGQDD